MGALAFLKIAKKDAGLRAKHIHDNFNHTTAPLLRIYAAYEKMCESLSLIDFAEILLRAHELLRDNPVILSISPFFKLSIPTFCPTVTPSGN